MWKFKNVEQRLLLLQLLYFFIIFCVCVCEENAIIFVDGARNYYSLFLSHPFSMKVGLAGLPAINHIQINKHSIISHLHTTVKFECCY